MKIFASVLLVALAFTGAVFAADPDPVVQAATTFTAWAKAWSPILIGALVLASPTLIVGITRYRKEGVSGFLLAVLDRFSFGTHSDSPGTFKLPGTSSKPPEDGNGVIDLDPEYRRVKRGHTQLGFLATLCLLSAFTLGACAALKSAARDADVKCQRDEVMKLIPAMRAFLDTVEQKDRGDLFKIQGEFLAIFAKADARDIQCTISETVAHFFGPDKPLPVPVEPPPDATLEVSVASLRTGPVPTERPSVALVKKLRSRLKKGQPLPLSVAEL